MNICNAPDIVLSARDKKDKSDTVTVLRDVSLRIKTYRAINGTKHTGWYNATEHRTQEDPE